MSFNFLVLGTGMMGRIVSPIIRQAGGEVVGVLGRTEEKARAFVKEIKLPNVSLAGGFMDYERALKTESIDAVAVLVPNYMHTEMGVAAANAGKHILMEKPLATNLSDAHSFLEAALSNNVAAEINSQYRHHELLCKLADMIDSAELGNPTYVEMNYLQDWQLNPFSPIGWRPEASIAGRGKLVGDLGAHVIQTTLHLFGGEFIKFNGETINVHPVRYKLKEGVQTFGAGEVPSFSERPDLYEKMDMLSEKYSGDDMARAYFVLKTASGIDVPGEYFLSQVHAGHKNDFTIDLVFEKGAVSWSQEEPNTLLIADEQGNKRIIERASAPGISGRPPGHPHGYGDAILIELEKMHTIVNSNNPETVTGYTERNIGQAVQSVNIMEQWLNIMEQWLSEPLINLTK